LGVARRGFEIRGKWESVSPDRISPTKKVVGGLWA